MYSVPFVEAELPAELALPDAGELGKQIAPRGARSRCIKQLHAALCDAKPDAPLDERLTVVERLARWVCDGPKPPAQDEAGAVESAPSARLRLLIAALETVPKFRSDLTGVVKATLAETSALDLFCEMGLPNPRGVWIETADRLSDRLLPHPPNPRDLVELLARMFRKQRDAEWLAEVPASLIAELGGKLDDPFLPLRSCAEDALRLLSIRVSALGLTADIRKRSPEGPVSESPFTKLPAVPLADVPALADACRAQLRVVHANMETLGVSVDVVYRIDLIELALNRIEAFAKLLRREEREARYESATRIAATLVAARIEERSLRDLIGDNTRLLARKIIERAGETGEHYITATRRQWWGMIASAAGGGFLTTGTCALKFLTKWGHFPLFIDGVLSSANYAASFVLMQLLGFTLATKQPSMTAPAIAAAIRGGRGKHDLEELVTMISRTCRSQLAAAIGNVGICIPTSIAFHLAFERLSGRSFLDPQTAQATIASFHPLESGTIPFAAFTGCLLWASSLGAGWLENWVTYRRVPEGITAHRWGRWLGRGTMRFFGRFLAHNVSGFGGNVTLGILLGMVPVLAKFFGVPLDVRHVTLSSGGLTLAACAIGPGVITTSAFLAAAGGISIIGLLNFGVSFALALFVAFRAREVTFGEAFRLFVQVVKRLFKAPGEFVFPPKQEAVPIALPAQH